jgi:hypothetical protein
MAMLGILLAFPTGKTVGLDGFLFKEKRKAGS